MSQSIEISIEATPNPATLKFQFNVKTSNETLQCNSIDESGKSPLATKIFGFPWTSAVYIGTDFITVTKQDWVDWKHLATPLAGLIKSHLEKGEAVLLDVDPNPSEFNANDSDAVKLIKKTLNQEIRPVVHMDGGDIVFVKYENQILYVHMVGACSGCPSSTATLKHGVEARLQEVLPELKEVVAV